MIFYFANIRVWLSIYQSWLWGGFPTIPRFRMLQPWLYLPPESRRVTAHQWAHHSPEPVHLQRFLDGDGGAGTTLERVELILPKCLYIYFKTWDIPFQWHVSKNCCSMVVGSFASWCFCGKKTSILNFRVLTSDSIDIEFGPLFQGIIFKGESRKCFTIAEIGPHFFVSQSAVFEKKLTVILFFKIWLQSKRSKHEMATCSSAWM